MSKEVRMMQVILSNLSGKFSIKIGRGLFSIKSTTRVSICHSAVIVGDETTKCRLAASPAPTLQPFK
jgi:hypothetical protein